MLMSHIGLKFHNDHNESLCKNISIMSKWVYIYYISRSGNESIGVDMSGMFEWATINRYFIKSESNHILSIFRDDCNESNAVNISVKIEWINIVKYIRIW